MAPCCARPGATSMPGPRALMLKFPDTAEAQPELLAHHYAQAGLIEDAARFWSKAGQRSIARSALAEAGRQLGRALDQLASIDETPATRREQMNLQVALATTLVHVKGYSSPDVIAAFERAGLRIDRAEALGERPRTRCWFRETRLRWAASSDDVALIDALLDVGAELERGGSPIDGGPLLSSAIGYGQWAGARRLVACGAKTQLRHEAALGMMQAIAHRIEGVPSLRGTHLCGPFWNACHGGQLAVEQYLYVHGADLNWPASWSGQTPLDIAEQAGRNNVVGWLLEKRCDPRNNSG